MDKKTIRKIKDLKNQQRNEVIKFFDTMKKINLVSPNLKNADIIKLKITAADDLFKKMSIIESGMNTLIINKSRETKSRIMAKPVDVTRETMLNSGLWSEEQNEE